MRIVIFGAGLIGSRLAAHLAERGYDAVALGRGDGIDVTTGQGVAAAVAGAEVVVDVTNSPTWADEEVLAFFRDSTAHLVAAGAAAGVKHHVILSIVGLDRLTDAGYMRAKGWPRRRASRRGRCRSRSCGPPSSTSSWRASPTPAPGVTPSTRPPAKPADHRRRRRRGSSRRGRHRPARRRRRRDRRARRAGHRRFGPPPVRSHRGPAPRGHRSGGGLLRRGAGRHRAHRHAGCGGLDRPHVVRRVAGHALGSVT
ncbi:hypothetical protein [Nocardioides convexus]|uniref:hypothetical protein n=1 Tax=Nocardioides convexus TaxID=2712224 RepID=UPI0024181F25|nr:hypothetical protein [Nocardioides convexus]